MSTLFVALLAMVGFIVAYHTYGRWLSRKLFGLDNSAPVPSHAQRDDLDFVPTRLPILFGHHFTSIAGTGPIVGPAIAVFWGWLPALLWVVFGAILIGGVHDFAALVISMRNRGQTIGETAGRLITPRARVLFLTLLALALFIVLAIFGLVIAQIFSLYPESVLSVWIAMPVAIAIGYLCYRQGGSLLIPSLLGVMILYGAVYVGVYVWPIDLRDYLPAEGLFSSDIVVWTFILMAYAFAASVLPVWLLLQPRDYINSHQLFVALALLVSGLVVASMSGSADIVATAPGIAQEVPADAPPIFPFLFITIACGACSGFHCLVSSGTSSKQINCETDAQPVGYGSMLLEGALAVLVIVACCAGVGMGPLQRVATETGFDYRVEENANGEKITGAAAWSRYYRASGEEAESWNKRPLKRNLAAFIDGGANFISSLGFSLRISVAIMATLVACFAATTLDTATRLLRYILQELAATAHVKPLTNPYTATLTAVGVALGIAMLAGEKPGTGGTLLWPIFGATNQMLAGLALMVGVFYLARRSKPTWPLLIPMLAMLTIPAWAIFYDIIYNWYPAGRTELVAFGSFMLALHLWMVAEGLSVWRSAKGNLEPPIRIPS